MMDPVTIGLAITSLIGIITKVVSWVKTYTKANAEALVPLSLASQTSSPASVLSFESNRNIPSSREITPSYHSHTDNSSSNSSVFFPLLFIFVIILGTMAFIIYRKQNHLKENYSKFRYTEKQIDSPPSPSTEQMDRRLTIV